MTRFNKRHWFYGFGVLAITVVICAVVGALSFSTLFLDPVGQVIKSFQFTDSYFHIENSSSDVVDANQEVVLYDISGCYSRAQIAGTIDNLYDKGAKVIALDVIFGGMGMDPAESDSLFRVMARCGDRTVSACRVVPTTEGFDIESSFYMPLTGSAEACVNVENEVVRKYSKLLVFNKDTLPSFVSVIAQKAGLEYADRIGQGELINYKQMLFDRIHITDSISEDDVKDKIVLVGDLEDLRDYHDVPVEIEGSRRISGTIIHAYALSSLSPNRHIMQMGTKPALVIGFVVSLLFCVLCCQVTEKYDKIAGLVMNVYQIVLLLALAFIGGLVFVKFNYNINLVYTMLGIGLAGFSTDLFYYITTTRPWKYVRDKIKGASK